MLCSEQIAQLSEIEDQINELGAELFVIGSGAVGQAAAARERLNSPFVFLVDSGRESFKVANLRRDFGSTVNIRTVPAIFRAWRKGHRQKRMQGDPFQQGGALVVMPGGTVAYKFISQFGGDHADPQDIVATLVQRPSND